ETIADAQDEAFLVAELPEDIAEEVLQLDGEDFAGSDVVTVREAAGNRHNLVLQKEFRVGTQAVDVQAFGESAGLLKGELGFAIAVGAGSTQDQDTRGSHVEYLRKNARKRLIFAEE